MTRTNEEILQGAIAVAQAMREAGMFYVMCVGSEGKVWSSFSGNAIETLGACGLLQEAIGRTIKDGQI